MLVVGFAICIRKTNVRRSSNESAIENIMKKKLKLCSGALPCVLKNIIQKLYRTDLNLTGQVEQDLSSFEIANSKARVDSIEQS